MSATSDTNPDATPNAEQTAQPALDDALTAHRTLYHALMSLNEREWLHLELSMGQLKALMTLTARENVGMTVGDVADALHVGKPAASMVVDRLTQLGYVTRHEDPDDRRRTIVTPTSQGETLAARLRQGAGEKALTRWLGRMAPDDLAAYIRGMRALADIAASETAQRTPSASDGSETY